MSIKDDPMVAPGLVRDSKQSTDPKTVPVYFSMVVWGEAFVNFFLEFCLPSLLAPGNIPFIEHRVGSKFILHTRDVDLQTIADSAAFRLLREVVEVEIRFLHPEGLAPHETLSRSHRETMRLADSIEVPVIFLSPDTIWSNGSIAAVDRILSRGKRVIFLSSLRLVKEDAEPFIKRLFESRKSVALSVEARRLNELAFRFLHPTMEEYFFEPGKGTALAPMLLLWSTPHGDILAHGFHQHPLLVYSKKRFADFIQTIDGDLVRAACPDPSDHYIVQDSDEITAIELSKRSQFLQGFMAKGDSAAVAAWALRYANSVHWSLIRAPIRMHAQPIDRVTWSTVESKAAEVVERIITYRRRHLVLVIYNDAFYWLVKKLLGVDRPHAQEWLFRRRHAISFYIRNKAFRGWHTVKFICQHTAYRSWHTVSFFCRDCIARRRHEISFHIRNKAFRGWHTVKFICQHTAYRSWHTVSFFCRDCAVRRRHELRNRIYRGIYGLISFAPRELRDRVRDILFRTGFVSRN
jgi:hypothetical protein